MKRVQIHITGAVQGVGFRPYIYRLAESIGLTGHVSNTSSGVFIQIQGPQARVDQFINRLRPEAPAVSKIVSCTHSDIQVVDGEQRFTVVESDDSSAKTVNILPDLATCPDCLADVAQLDGRRHNYAFTNCTNCGPRFSIINDIPYDRPNTEMRNFIQCPACMAEYTDPEDRRFHAQPNACPDCGPMLICDTTTTSQPDPIAAGAEVITGGQILALKGLGGYQLLCAANSPTAVIRLRARKHRPDKPMAVMFPHLQAVEDYCHVSADESALLRSVAAPIVLLKKRKDSQLADEIAPGNPYLGAMLPYTPLHHLLMALINQPVICTSGNLHDEPIALDNDEAHSRLANIADAFLEHNRPIARQLDDSVVRASKVGTQYLRRARGYAPSPIYLKGAMPNVLAVGGHLKNTIAIMFADQLILSQHIGDLSTPQAHDAFRKILDDLPRLYDFAPDLVATDLHPDYLSTQVANDMGLPLRTVQHHHAHIGAVMAENHHRSEVLGVSWDGTGLGTDGTIWGGEFLLCDGDDFERLTHLKPFPLPGGDRAALEPRRSALGLLHSAGRLPNFDHNFNDDEMELLTQALATGLNTPLTSSMGRLFDAIGALVGLGNTNRFEGQTAMALEFAAAGKLGAPYPFTITPTIDWTDLLAAIITDVQNKVELQTIAASYHGTLVEMILQVAQNTGVKDVALGGGCFQNLLLLEGAVERLNSSGFNVLLPRILPINDGGLSAGQAWLAGVSI
jgi:hydrogenase maturation protein HypF